MGIFVQPSPEERERRRVLAATPVNLEFDGVVHLISRRDSQRARVYAAERKAFGAAFYAKVDDVSLEGLQRLVDRVTGSATWKKLFHRNPKVIVPGRVEVRPGYAARAAFARCGTITLPKWSRTLPIILHELAHVVAGGAVGHHWPFASHYIDLVGVFMGAEAKRTLKQQFKAHRVRFTPPRKRAPLSPERLEDLRARGRALAARRAARFAEINAASKAAEDRAKSGLTES